MIIKIQEEQEKISNSIKTIKNCAEEDIFVPRTLYTLKSKEVFSVIELLNNYNSLLNDFKKYALYEIERQD